MLPILILSEDVGYSGRGYEDIIGVSDDMEKVKRYIAERYVILGLKKALEEECTDDELLDYRFVMEDNYIIQNRITGKEYETDFIAIEYADTDNGVEKLKELGKKYKQDFEKSLKASDPKKYADMSVEDSGTWKMMRQGELNTKYDLPISEEDVEYIWETHTREVNGLWYNDVLRI